MSVLLIQVYKNLNRRCEKQLYDSWCPRHHESTIFQKQISESGPNINPKYTLSNVKIGTEESLTVDFVVNSTQNSDFHVEKLTKCQDGICTTTVQVSPDVNFCLADGQKSEFFNVKLNVEGIVEEAVMKFHVPCACACSDIVEERSPKCNGRGNYSCGVCTTGKFCETAICEKKRGDMPCTDSARSDLECSGNGVCGDCDECECFTNKLGSQYFDKDNFCADICLVTNDCDECFQNPIPGRCDLCDFPLFRQTYNQTLMKEKDDFNRDVWVRCNDTMNGCNMVYAAMKDASGDTFYMMIDSCEPVHEEQVTGSVNVTLPVVLGVLALVAAVMGTAGYLVWKNRPPPMQPLDPMYQNIGAEDCTGENPLYKPPTSSFKNPTYGKW
ncbi:unnamed protein product [Leptidea sinapis]|uniref:Uncharacterized protein n=1 Tax=Leptidea sinapis TaxID=189913 RepID=A0A5E4QG79_9NEOP|nr:unnamed protein product [Leptidea sinapis]